eukprot:m.815543 g.815543  ORF g.815543 m.815543 type:complete len:565 (-) comp59374_c0_seq4:231-1925(-)
MAASVGCVSDWSGRHLAPTFSLPLTQEWIDSVVSEEWGSLRIVLGGSLQASHTLLTRLFTNLLHCHKCTIICFLSAQDAQFIATQDLEPIPASVQQFDAFAQEYTQILRENYQGTSEFQGVQIQCAQAAHSDFGPGTFFLPRSHQFFPQPHREQIGFDELSTEAQIGYRQFAVDLHHALEAHGLAGELHCYALGPAASSVSDLLCQLRTEWSDKSRGSCAVVLVDRALDLVGPLSHSENFADRLFNTHLDSAHSFWTDVEVDLSDVTNCNAIHGTISHPQNAQATDLLLELARNKQKEALVIIRKQLTDLLNSLKLGPPIKPSLTKVTLQQLKTHLATLKANPGAWFEVQEIVQCLVAATKTLERVENSKYDELLSAEKVLSVSSDNLMAQLLEVLRSFFSGAPFARASTLHEDVLLLVAFAHSLVDLSNEAEDVEAELQRHVRELIQSAGQRDPDEVKDLVQDAFDIMVRLANQCWWFYRPKLLIYCSEAHDLDAVGFEGFPLAVGLQSSLPTFAQDGGPCCARPGPPSRSFRPSSFGLASRATSDWVWHVRRHDGRAHDTAS